MSLIDKIGDGVLLYKGDCLEEMDKIPDGSVDFVLTDLPYGTTAGNCKWDKTIPFDKLWNQYTRLLKDNGVIALFASQPFTSHLITSNSKMYRYSWVWIKSKATQFLEAKIKPMKKHEEIVVFSNHPICPCAKQNPTYNPQGLIGLNQPKVMRHKKQSSCISGRGNYSGREFVKEYTNYPNSVLEFPNDGNTVHPTQKPLALCEYFVNTYTNIGDLVLDSCMGSGTTGIAAINTDRRFVGIELDEKYYNISAQRISDTLADKHGRISC